MLQFSQKWINDQLEDWKFEQQLKHWKIKQPKRRPKGRPIDDYGKYHIHLFVE